MSIDSSVMVNDGSARSGGSFWGIEGVGPVSAIVLVGCPFEKAKAWGIWVFWNRWFSRLGSIMEAVGARTMDWVPRCATGLWSWYVCCIVSVDSHGMPETVVAGGRPAGKLEAESPRGVHTVDDTGMVQDQTPGPRGLLHSPWRQ